MLIDTIKKNYQRVDQGECFGKCQKKVIKDTINPEAFIVICNGCKRIIFEKKPI